MAEITSRSFLKPLRSLRFSFTRILQTLALAWRSSAFCSAAIMALTMISSLVPLGMAYVAKLIIDAVVARSVELTVRWIAAELLLVLMQSLVGRLQALLRSLLSSRMGLDVNAKILEKSVELELSQFEDSEFYNKLTQAKRESSSRPANMVNDSLQFVQTVLTLFGYAALLVSFNPLAVVAMLVAALPSAVSEARFTKAIFRLQNWRSPERRRLNYLEYILTSDIHAKELKVLDLGQPLLSRYRDLGEKFFLEDRRLLLRRFLWSFFLSLLTTGVFYGCYLAMAVSAARGLITLGSLTMYAMAFRQGQSGFQSLLGAIGNLYEHALYMQNLFEFLEIKPPASAKISPRPPTAAKGVTFDHVSFRYPGREEWALQDFHLHLPEGKSVAIVGFNGAGKTTVIKLLARLYDPTEGAVLVDGRDLRDWPREELWARISVIFQDFNRYQFTFRENVGVGDFAHRENEGRIQSATELGGAADFLPSLKDGMNTQLGRMFTDGIELSGGQWQKVALARAFMRTEASILVLDEPTAALDAQAEFTVMERFRNLTKGKTSFLISHRFPTARLADEIVVMEKGRIVEQGTHQLLVAKSGGLYSRLFTMQAQGYT